MPPAITAFLFVQANATNPIEKLIVDAQCAAALDTLERLQSINAINELVIATNDSKFAVKAARLGAHVDMDEDDQNFSWGNRMRGLVAKYHPVIPFYIGGGSGVLMGVQDWGEAIQTLIANQNIVVTNNFFSSDFAGWTPPDALARIQIPDLDNNLAFLLGEHAGLKVHSLAKNAATQFDIDTPTDLMTIHSHPGVGNQLSKFLESQKMDVSRVRHIQSLFKKRDATLLIAGRVSGAMASLLEHATRCQWRIVSEERGMRASGREDRGEARSLLGALLERAGAAEFIALISQMAQAAIIDTRVLFAHHHLKPTAHDRFYCDLLEPEKISEPFLRDLATAARDAPIPILFGGHSLVAGGMYAMVETAFMV